MLVRAGAGVVPGTDAASVWPSGERVTLLAAGADGRREIAGGRVAASSDGDTFVASGPVGAAYLFAKDGRVIAKLGAFEHAVFAPMSRFVFAWSKTERAVFDTRGKLLASARGEGGEPLFLPGSSILVERFEGAAPRVRLSKLPSLSPIADLAKATAELHAGVHRLLVAEEDRASGRWGFLSVFDTESGDRVARAPIPDDGSGVGPSRFSVSADAKKVAWALATTAVLDLDSGKTTFLERRPAGDDAPPSRAPIFTADASHLCVDRDGHTDVLPMPATTPGYEPHCWSVPRSAAEGDSNADADAVVASIVVSSGFRLLVPTPDPSGSLVGDALAPDRSLAVVSEVSMRDAKSRSPLRLQLVVFDVALGAPRIRIPVGTADAVPSAWNVAVDAKSVTYCDAKGACAKFDVGSGARVASGNDLLARTVASSAATSAPLAGAVEISTATRRGPAELVTTPDGKKTIFFGDGTFEVEGASDPAGLGCIQGADFVPVSACDPRLRIVRGADLISAR